MKQTFFVGDYVSLATNPNPVNVIYEIKAFAVSVDGDQVHATAELSAVKTFEYEHGRILVGTGRVEDVRNLVNA